MGKKFKTKRQSLPAHTWEADELYNAVPYVYPEQRILQRKSFKKSAQKIFSLKPRGNKINGQKISSDTAENYENGHAQEQPTDQITCDLLESKTKSKKKKKKKDRADDTDVQQLENGEGENHEPVTAEDHLEEVKCPEDGMESRKKKKKEKKKNSIVDKSLEYDCDENSESKLTEKNGSKKTTKKKDTCIINDGEKSRCTVETEPETSCKKSKKKKKKRNSSPEKIVDELLTDRDSTAHCDQNTNSSAAENEAIKKSKKKKRKNKDISPVQTLHIEPECSEQAIEADKPYTKIKKNKSKKKKHIDHSSNSDELEENSQDTAASEKDTSEKASSKKRRIAEDSEEIHRKKKKKVKRCQGDVENGAVTNDSDSNMCDKNESSTIDPVGQWSTAALGDTNRKHKFLRLMGGMKTASDNNVPDQHSGNRAMNAQQEADVNSALETQFTKAMELIVNNKRGKGIGFAEPAGANKKFHIDVNKTKSMKFDD